MKFIIINKSFCLGQDEEEEEEFFNQRYARGRDGLISEYVILNKIAFFFLDKTPRAFMALK